MSANLVTRELAAKGGRVGRWRLRRLRDALGGRARMQVIVLFACVLGLNTADLSSLGAIAGQLKLALHIDNTQLGVLAAAPSVVAAVFTLPFGVLADRTRRVRVLVWIIALWAGAMIVCGAASSFTMLLFVRMALGGAAAASGPLVASLIGDLFAPEERGRVYGYVVAGEPLGTLVGLLIAGNLAALSWRAALWLLALPSFPSRSRSTARSRSRREEGGAACSAATRRCAPRRRWSATAPTGSPVRAREPGSRRRTARRAAMRSRGCFAAAASSRGASWCCIEIPVTVSGRMVPPKGMSSFIACRGYFDITFRVGQVAVQSLRAGIHKDCTFSLPVVFHNSKRLNGGKVTVHVLFAGNRFLHRREAPVRTIQVG